MQAELKSFMYIDRSLHNKNDGLINELKFKKCMHLKRSIKRKFFIGLTNKQRKYIIYLNFMVENAEITDQFIHNLKIILKTEIGNKYPSTNTQNLTHH